MASESQIGRVFCGPLWTCLVFLCLSAAPLSAEEFGLFTYSVDGDEVTITDYPEGATGDVEIPAVIDGKPVTSIDRYAFEDCKRIASVSIPDSVTAIGAGAFEESSIHPTCLPDRGSIWGILLHKMGFGDSLTPIPSAERVPRATTGRSSAPKCLENQGGLAHVSQNRSDAAV